MEVYSPKVIIGFVWPTTRLELDLGVPVGSFPGFLSLSLSVILKRGLWFPYWLNYQRKLGRNTSGLRTNRIVRLDINEGWCATRHHLTKYHKRIDIDEGWCATWHHLTIYHKQIESDEGWCAAWHHIAIHHKRIDIDEGWRATWHHITIHHKRIDIDEGRCENWHHIAIHNKRIIGYDTGWWRREVVTKGSGD